MKDPTTFKHKKWTFYGTNVAFKKSNCPSGNSPKSNYCFRNKYKHKLYGFKNEVSGLLNGFGIDLSPRCAWSVSYMTLFRDNMKFHERTIRKTSEEFQRN